ncbi:unnamed protein product [Mesocestoides corti]|nr:unnamed protein product [Mesocestoides corti]
MCATSLWARPTTHHDLPDEGAFSRWRRPFFNPYPSWVSYLKQVYRQRHGSQNEEDLNESSHLNPFPSLELHEHDYVDDA